MKGFDMPNEVKPDSARTETPKLLKKIDAVVEWLNGKKTALGGALQTLSYLGMLAYPAGAPVWAPMQAVGAVLTGGGLTHKAFKFVAAKRLK